LPGAGKETNPAPYFIDLSARNRSMIEIASVPLMVRDYRARA